MAKKQTRRSISVTREFHAQLQAYAEASGNSMSQVVESQILLVTGGLRPATDDDEPKDKQ